MMTRYLHTAARLVITRLLPNHAKLVLCAVAKLVILAHVAIIAYFGYCLSLNLSTMPLTWSDLSAM